MVVKWPCSNIGTKCGHLSLHAAWIAVGYQSTNPIGGPTWQPPPATHHSSGRRPMVTQSSPLQGTMIVPLNRRVQPRHPTSHRCATGMVPVAWPPRSPLGVPLCGTQYMHLGGVQWPCNNGGCIGRPSTAQLRCVGPLRIPQSPCSSPPLDNRTGPQPQSVWVWICPQPCWRYARLLGSVH